MKKQFLVILFMSGLLTLLQGNAQASDSYVKKENGQWQLYVNGAPYKIKGATFGMPVFNKADVGKYMKDLKSMGVNSIRTWGTGKETKVLLDSANAFGIKVLVGIWMRHGRPGGEGDDSFDYLTDKKGMEDMYNGALESVRMYKDHPAVLAWGVGNEVTLNIATDKEKEVYAKFLERIVVAIKGIDSKHAVASVSAWTTDFQWWKHYTPSLDIYGINAYGGGAYVIPDEMEKMGLDKPYMICEFGVSGEWDAKKDSNGLTIEPTDKQKYDAIATGYKEWVLPKKACLGAFVFNYGDGDNFGTVWLNMFFNGAYRPSYWATREAYTGKKPAHALPDFIEYKLPVQNKSFDTWIPVLLKLKDTSEGIPAISFHYNQRTGGRARRDQINELEFRGDYNKGFEIKVPRENGLIKVYVFAKDKYNTIGIAQNSLLIDNGRASETMLPGAKVKFPFAVYDEGINYPYSPSGYMGDFQNFKVDGENKEQAHSGTTSFKLTYNASGGWYGIAFLDPVNDWGDRAGGYNFMGATKLTFWAKSTSSDVSGTFGFGMIDRPKTFFDTGKKSERFQLTTEWQKYEIDLKGLDLRCIKTGFIMYLGGIGQNYSFWLDDIQYEK